MSVSKVIDADWGPRGKYSILQTNHYGLFWLEKKILWNSIWQSDVFLRDLVIVSHACVPTIPVVEPYQIVLENYLAIKEWALSSQKILNCTCRLLDRRTSDQRRWWKPSNHFVTQKSCLLPRQVVLKIDLTFIVQSTDLHVRELWRFVHAHAH